MKILMITESLIKGGKERRLIELLRYFSDHYQVEIELILLKDKIQYEEIHEIKNVNLHVFKRFIKKDPFILFRILKLHRKIKPDLIHSWGTMPSVYTFLIAFFTRTPLLNAMISNAICKPWSSNWLRAKLTFPFSKIILSNSKAGLEAYHAHSKKGRVIFNGFNKDRINKLEDEKIIRNKYNLKAEILIGMVGAFHPRKDYKSYLEAATMLVAAYKNVEVIAIGDGSQLPELKEKYNQYDRIKFLGRIDQVESLVNILDIGVLLTDPNQHQEGISNALMEMMALEKPVIATNGGGTTELVEDHSTGLLVEALSAKAAFDAISSLIEDPSLAKKMGLAAKKRIDEEFSIEKMCKETFKLYQEMTTR